LAIDSAIKISSSNFCLSIISISKDISKQATASFTEPRAFPMYLLKSLSDSFAEPSAMFRIMDSTALLNCYFKSKSKILGKPSMTFKITL